MRALGILLLSSVLAAGTATASADPGPIDCSKKSLGDAVSKAETPERTVLFTGVCSGPIVIRADGITVKGVGTAIIDGGGVDAVTIAGARNVALSSLEVRNGRIGILGTNGAHLTLTDVNTHDNSLFGISLQTASSARLRNVTINRSGIHGLDLETGASATVSGSLTTSNNRVFGLNVNGSAITFSQANVSATRNALGIQIATNANAFINDSATVINAMNNFATGLTVVSGGHLVSFGGTINATGNQIGVSVNSKGGLDLDAGSVLNSTNNGGDGVLLQEGSVMTVFNNPQFSGASGFSTLHVSNNGGSGLNVLNGSTLTLSNNAKLVSQQNTKTGFLADNRSGVTLVHSTITDNTERDIQLTFGTNADFQTLTFGSVFCDATVLIRGTSGITCPH